MDRFESLGFPSVADEEWKYTNLAPWAKGSFTPASNQSHITRDAVQSLRSHETANSHLVLVNGFLREDLSSKSALDEIVAVDLFSAIGDARYSKVVREYLARNANYLDSGLVSLNTAFLRSGLFIFVPKNVHVNQPIHVTYVSDEPGDDAVSFPRRRSTLAPAREMLSSSCSVKRVAYSLGFRQVSQFCRDFKARFGHRPSLELPRSERSPSFAASDGTSSALLRELDEIGDNSEDLNRQDAKAAKSLRMRSK